MAPAIPAATVQLSYPLYACDFDPQNPGRVVVGGGGGAGRSGVGNKISVLDALTPFTLDYNAEIDLSKEEDNVTSLAVGPKKGKNILIYAGINTAPKDAEQGKNKHFRIFGLEPPAVSKTGIQTTNVSKLSELSRTTVFNSRNKDVYQRVLRLSKPFSSGVQVGAIATGLDSKTPEIVVFDTSGSATTVNVRGHIQLKKEASDLDVIQSGSDEHKLVYVDDHNIFYKTFSKKSTEDPILVYKAPELDFEGKPPVPSFRAVRFLTPEFVVVLKNLPGRSGVDLLTFRISIEEGKLNGRITRTFRLPKKITQASGLSTVNLSPFKDPSVQRGYAQFLIAVAGQDNSISLFKLEHQTEASISIVTQPKLIRTLPEVHPQQITNLAFSNFVPPKDASSKPTLKLASVSVGNTAVVHSIPIEEIKGSYVLSLPEPRTYVPSPTSLLAILIVALLAILGQAALEFNGTTPPVFGVTNYISPDTWREDLQNAPKDFSNWFFSTYTPPVSSPTPSETTTPAHEASHSSFTESSFASALAALQASNAEGHPIIIHPPPSPDSASHETNPEIDPEPGTSTSELKIQAKLHDEAVHGPLRGKKWEELSEKQKKVWLGHLGGLEAWAGALPENLLQGVFWAEVAGAVGGAVGGGG